MNHPAMSQSTPLFPNLGALAGTPAALPASDMELQKMLIDERMRCEHHKTNYQTLKAEHTRLQTEFTRAHDELKRLLVDKQAIQDKHQLLLAELQGDLLDKTRELEELRTQVLTPQKLELLRAQIQQELEVPVRERFSKLEEETEKYRSDFNKLRYEYTFLKSEFDHQREEHARVLEERKMRFDAEVSRLEKEKEELSGQLLSSDPARDGRRLEVLLRDKAQLLLRLKGLEGEVAQLRAERDSSGAQAENVQRIQVRQLAESQAAVKALEAEKQSLRLQAERLESELRLSLEQSTTLTGRLHKAERQVNLLTSQVEQLKHSHKLEVANVKLESVRARAEVGRERDALQSQLEGLQLDVEVLKEALERNRELLVEKEREAVRRVQAAREEEFHKMAAVQEEKLELENRISELEQQRALQEAAGSSQKEEWEERLRAAQLGEETARREAQSLRVKVQQQGLQQDELMREKQENGELRLRNQEMSVQLGTLGRSEAELLEANHRLREMLDRLKEELRTARSQAEKAQHEAERALEERRVEWLEEKHKLQERDTELQEKYSQAKERLQRAALAQKKRKTMNEHRERKLQDKIQLLEAKIAELELETQAAKKPAHAEERAHLHRRLKELQRRHGEFRRLLLGSQLAFGPAPGADAPFGGLHDAEHQELAVLRRRLEELESSQQQQLEELGPPLDRDQERDVPSQL
ncbi:centrosomal protein of 83 kDa isoform X1 [Anguilla anguilla]|uniref:centrosomal protein of 83 kDa isoform X1 n=1 Tax=Anguilla anguilla TaxID=7936 RepID=UPI0015B2405E|nr:centrosomal protein of 83 kDa isoform X1 [Anguilla anguilla]XP_035281905.1 centrosomal protein of 83 kDa isoform X1 [Anguilla anguilla]XP_035281906.1 centrosomal protein of 83 kDa isoform X1 [Anguilla anguilla]XP_035281907.1 centrosomal protein of 83 kDa isoform X1 [Anguilla anguilla]